MRRIKRNVLVGFLIFIAILFLIMGGLYVYESSPVDSNSNADVEVIIPNGMTTKNIAKILKNKNLIRNETFFLVYAKMNGANSLKASTYLFKKSMSMDKIVEILSQGNIYNASVVNITFHEGKRLTDYALSISKKTNNSYDDIINTMKDTTYLTELKSKYWFLTDEVLNTSIYYPLEGYLAPNTYQFKNKDVSIKEITETMLDQTARELAPYKDKILKSNYSVHQYITLASMAELEGRNAESRKMICGVFFNRLIKKMSLGSDVTTYYALQAAMTSDLTVKQFNTVNPYNTRGPGMEGKLPVGPICNPSLSSIKASIEPTSNDNLFFVADKNGKVYYTKTNEEHIQKVQEIKDAGDWIW